MGAIWHWTCHVEHGRDSGWWMRRLVKRARGDDPTGGETLPEPYETTLTKPAAFAKPLQLVPQCVLAKGVVSQSSVLCPLCGFSPCKTQASL